MCIYLCLKLINLLHVVFLQCVRVSPTYVCDCFSSIAVSGRMYRLPGCLESICCRGYVGCIWRRHACSPWCIRPCRRLCQVFHHLQPYGLPAVQAQLSRMSLQRHIYVTTEDLQGKPTVRPQRTLQTHLTAQQEHEHLRALLKWTARQLWGVSGQHWKCWAVSCDYPPKDCLHPDWLHLQRGNSQPALSQTTGWCTLVEQPPSFMKQTRQDRPSTRQERLLGREDKTTKGPAQVRMCHRECIAWQYRSRARIASFLKVTHKCPHHCEKIPTVLTSSKKHFLQSGTLVMFWWLLLYQLVSRFILMYSSATAFWRSRKWGRTVLAAVKVNQAKVWHLKGAHPRWRTAGTY